MHLCSLFVSLPIWISFIPVAILNGGFRDYVLVKFLPDKCALAVSGIILSILILLVAKILEALPYGLSGYILCMDIADSLV